MSSASSNITITLRGSFITNMYNYEELSSVMSNIIDDMKKNEVNGTADWVYLAALGYAAKNNGIIFQDYSCNSFLEFVQNLEGITLYKDEKHEPPVYYVKKSGLVRYASRKGILDNHSSYGATPPPKFTDWAYIGDNLATFMDLRDMSLHENWGDYEDPWGRIHYPILENYLNYTFQKLYVDNQILYSANDSYAAFNTGLVDYRYLPIFALFNKNRNTGRQQWFLIDFCIAGENKAGKILNAEFKEMPRAAMYFNSISDMLYDTSMDLPALDIEHIVLERTSRLPYDFLCRHIPTGFSFLAKETIKSMDKEERDKFYYSLSMAIDRDKECYRSIATALNNSLSIAVKRVQWNFKAAIPMYYPIRQKMCLFLPLSLVRDDNVDLALVVEKTNSGRYQGSTIYELEWAYKCARLVCRPDSDWLKPNG